MKCAKKEKNKTKKRKPKRKLNMREIKKR